MEIFYREKAFHAGDKIKKKEKNDFAPSEKFSCYVPVYKALSQLINRWIKWVNRGGVICYVTSSLRKNTDNDTLNIHMQRSIGWSHSAVEARCIVNRLFHLH